LADFQSLADENDGHRFCLIAVDVLSRQLFAVPIKSKTTNEMKRAFNELFSQMIHPPSELYTDLGLEFESKEMREFFKQWGIAKFGTRTGDVKAAVAERFIRTLKQRLYKYFSEKNTLRWIDVLPKIVYAINNTVNSATGMKPSAVNSKNSIKLWNSLYGAYLFPENGQKKTPLYKEGDAVRMSKKKRTFEKGYLANFTGKFLYYNYSIFDFR
jgi:hypothetical protein